MTPSNGGATLCVANYASDVGYAWWLMEHFWAELARLGQRSGRRTFVAFPKVRDVSPVLREAGITPVDLTVPTSFRPRSLKRLGSFIRRNDVRTIYLTDRPYWSPVYGLLRLWGVRRIIIHDHVPGERPHPPGWKLAAKRTRHALRFGTADLYIGVSRFVYDRFTRIAGIPRERCAYVHNGVPRIERCLPIRRELGLPADSRIVVSSGRVVSYKGIDFLIRCAERIVGDGSDDVRFVHFGHGPEYDRFSALVRELGLEDRFILAGARADVTALLSSCDIALHASRGEAFSLAILEFMAAGLPAVVPDHCGNAEAIEDDVTGVLYEPGNLDLAESAIRRLLDEPQRRARLGGAAARRAREEFSLVRMRSRFAELVEPLV